MAGAYLVSLPGLTPYESAWALQRSIAAAVIEGTLPDTVLLLEHEPVVTLGRRTDESECRVREQSGQRWRVAPVQERLEAVRA